MQTGVIAAVNVTGSASPVLFPTPAERPVMCHVIVILNLIGSVDLMRAHSESQVGDVVILNLIGSVDMMRAHSESQVGDVVILNLIQNLPRMRCEPRCISKIALLLT
jgi:hypothetical protein